MPRQAGPPYFIGKHNGVIGFKLGDKYFFRKMPEKVTQSTETKQASKDFSSASSYSKLLRQALHRVMDIKQHSTLTNRLNTILAKILREDKDHKTGHKVMSYEHMLLLKGFAFNKETKVDNVLHGLEISIAYDVHISVSIPSVPRIKRTRNTTHIEIKAIALSPDFAKGTCKETASEALMINAREPFQPITLTMLRPGNQATIIILQVRPFEQEHGKFYVLEDKKYFAADIMGILPMIPLMKFKKAPAPKKRKSAPRKKGRQKPE